MHSTDDLAGEGGEDVHGCKETALIGSLQPHVPICSAQSILHSSKLRVCICSFTSLGLYTYSRNSHVMVTISSFSLQYLSRLEHELLRQTQSLF
jgi:hypothetical protein